MYGAHLRAFLAAAEEADPARRLERSLAVLGDLDGIRQDWEALRDLATAETYAAGTVKQGELAGLLGLTQSGVSWRVKEIKKRSRLLGHVVSAAKQAARNQG